MSMYTAQLGKKQTLIGNTTFKVSSPTGTLEVKNYSESKGSFEVILKNVTSKSGVNAVYIPVWSESNQSDIVWYQADKQSDGSYKVIVKTKNHNQNTIYNIHAYVTDQKRYHAVCGRYKQRCKQNGAQSKYIECRWERKEIHCHDRKCKCAWESQ